MVADRSNPHSTILCLFSGGIDSTGVLHQLMTDAQYVDHPLIVHHIHILNRENRFAAEAIASKQILEYYLQHSDRPFLITESVFNSTGFAPLKSPRFPFDMDVCSFYAGQICAARPDIRFVAIGLTQTDLADPISNRRHRAKAIFEATLCLEPKPLPEYIYPVFDYTKEEIWNLLPPEVREKTWWCRCPVYDPQNQPHACGNCKTCRQVAEFLNPSISFKS
ncbi:MAG: hypothetical protein ACO3EZ_05960 [Prochlorotrichaceae cyanobacterium]